MGRRRRQYCLSKFLTYINMKVPLVVKNAPRKDIEVEWSANILRLVRAPFEGSQADLEG